MKRKILIFSIFMLMILTIIPLTTNAGLIEHNSDFSLVVGKPNIVRAENGDLWTVWVNDTDDDLYIYKSTDSGVSWSNITKIAGTITYYGCVIDDTDIHIAFLNSGSANYYALDLSNESLHSFKVFDSSSDSLDITMDVYGDVYVAVDGGTAINCYVRNHVHEGWSGAKQVLTGSYSVPEIAVDLVGNVWVVTSESGNLYQTRKNASSNDFWEANTYKFYDETDPASQYTLTVDGSSRFQLVFHSGADTIIHMSTPIDNSLGFTLGPNTVIDTGFGVNHPSIVIDSSNRINVLACGETDDLGTQHIYFTYSENQGGYWHNLGKLAYLNSNTYNRPVALFQQHNTYNTPAQEFAFVYNNDSDSTFMYGTSGDVLYLSDSQSGGYEDAYPFSTAGLTKVGDLQDNFPLNVARFINYFDTATEVNIAQWINVPLPLGVPFPVYYTNSYTLYDDYSYVETRYDNKITGTVKNFALKMPVGWREVWGGSYTDLQLKINGEFAGACAGYYPMSINFDMFYWTDIDINITDSKTVIELLSTNQPYRYVLLLANDDIDSDGDADHGVHGDGLMWNGQYDYTNIVLDDFVYAFWYDKIGEVGIEDYPYSLSASPSEVTQYTNPIGITYTCPIDDNVRLRIAEGGVLKYDESTTKTGITAGAFTYTPTEAGDVNISLYCSDNDTYMINRTVTSNAFTGDYAVYTVPSITNPNEAFKIYYIYNASTFNGILRVGNKLSYNVLKNTDTLTAINVPNGIADAGVYDVCLYMDANGTEIIRGECNQHFVKSSTGSDMWVRLETESLQKNYYDEKSFGYNSYVNGEVFFEGYHNYPNGEVCIEIGSTSIYVGNDASHFKKVIPVMEGGTYNANLVVYIESSRLVLANFTLGVGEAVETDDTDEIFPELGVLMGAIVGLILVAFLTLSPLMILKGLKSRHGVPPILYVLMCLIGIVVATIFGWFPSWVIIFIVIMSIVMLAIQYVLKNSGNGSGD